MVYRRRSYRRRGRKTNWRRRRYYARRGAVRPGPTSVAKEKTTTITRCSVSNALLQAQDSYGAGNFKLNSLPGFNDFCTLYDMYKINKVTVTWIFSKNSGDPADATMSELPIIYAAFDPDDDTPASTIHDLLNFPSARWARMDKALSLTLTPVPAMMMYKTLTTTGYGVPSGPQWIDCTSADIPHYGAKWYIQTFNSGQAPTDNIGTITTITRYNMSFKGIH